MRRLIACSSLLLVTSVLGGLVPATPTPPASAALPSCSATGWLAAWYAAPSDAVLSQPPLEQTFRVQVRPLHGGGVARFRLSNRFGSGPVTFGAVTVGTQLSGPAIVGGTLHRVTFGGAGRVTVPAHSEVVSDRVRMTVRAGRVLLLSMHVVGSPGPATQHAIAEQTTWQSPPLSGNRTANLSGSGFFALPLPLAPTLPQNIPYLAGMDVRAPKSVGTVVTFGDSITDGTEAEALPFILSAQNINRFYAWPDRLAARIQSAGLPFSVANAAISGNQLTHDSAIPVFGRSGLSRFTRDALARKGVTTVILLEGINDIGQSLVTRDQLVAGYQQAIAAAHARGVRILLGTLTPMGGTIQPPAYGALGEPTRVAVNRWIRSQSLADGVIDFDLAVRDPARPTRILPAYDGGDHLHFSGAGYQAMANAVPLSLLERRACD